MSDINKTIREYDAIITKCESLFSKKMQDYGTSWRILRPSSLTDQIYIKAKRIRTLQQAGDSKIEEGQEVEFVGIINYCALALVQLDLSDKEELELDHAFALKKYQEKIAATKELMIAKNHDYGEAWRDMRVSSLTDLILQKLHRIKQIEDNKGKTIVSEGVDAGYMDMINYAVFSLIKLEY